MNRRQADIESALPLSSPAFLIMLALADHERHGYSIIKEVEASTGGAVELLAGTLYQKLKQMLADGWIVEVEGDEGDERRRFYRLTPRGKRIAEAESARLESLVRLARSRRFLPASGKA
jgi:DNA-binding PadR family transcriptional regulator